MQKILQKIHRLSKHQLHHSNQEARTTQQAAKPYAKDSETASLAQSVQQHK